MVALNQEFINSAVNDLNNVRILQKENDVILSIRSFCDDEMTILNSAFIVEKEKLLYSFRSLKEAVNQYNKMV